MDNNPFVEKFPHIVSTLSDIAMTLTQYCYDPDLPQMLSKLDAVVTDGLIGTPFVSKTPKIQQVQETWFRQSITGLIAHTHDPDKEVMLSKLRRLSEASPQDLLEFARKEASAPKSSP